MRTFILTCVFVRNHYPILWDHSRRHNRLIMVRYHLPADQFELFPGFKAY